MKSILYSLLVITVFSCTSVDQSTLCSTSEDDIFEYPANLDGWASSDFHLKVFNDYDEGLACAQKSGKPIFLLFTGFGLFSRTNYLPDRVLQDPRIVRRLVEDYVPIFLMVDDRKKLSPSEQAYWSEHYGKKIRTEGNRYSAMEIEMFEKQSQPLMVLMNWEEEKLTPLMGYNPNIDGLVTWLDEGLAAFNAL